MIKTRRPRTLYLFPLNLDIFKVVNGRAGVQGHGAVATSGDAQRLFIYCWHQSFTFSSLLKSSPTPQATSNKVGCSYENLQEKELEDVQSPAPNHLFHQQPVLDALLIKLKCFLNKSFLPTRRWEHVNSRPFAEQQVLDATLIKLKCFAQSIILPSHRQSPWQSNILKDRTIMGDPRYCFKRSGIYTLDQKKNISTF